MTSPQVKENFPVFTSAERILGGQKGRGALPHNKCGHAPTGLCSGIYLYKMLNTHLGEGPRTDRSGVIKKKKKKDNWPKLNKDQRGLSYIKDLNHLFTMLFLIRGGNPHPFSLCIYFCLASVLSKLFLCVLSHIQCYVSNNKCCSCIYSFWLLETFLLSNGRKKQGYFASGLPWRLRW